MYLTSHLVKKKGAKGIVNLSVMFRVATAAVQEQSVALQMLK